MTTTPQVKEAVYDALVTAWNAQTPPVPYLELDNEAYTPSNSAPWARAVIREMSSQQWTLGPVGGRKFKRTAALIVQIFVQPNIGSALADSYAKIIRDTFEGDPTESEDIGWNAVSVKEIGNSQQGWYQVNVTASFWYHEVK